VIGLGLLAFAVPLALFGLLVLLVVGLTGRDEPDPDGLRPRALYLTSVCFVALFAALFSLFAVVASLVGLALDDEDDDFALAAGPVLAAATQDFADRDSDDEHVSNAVGAALGAAAAGGVLWFHARRLQELVREHDIGPGPVRRAWRAYLHAVCFVAIGVTAVAGAVAAYGLFEAAAPGVTGVESRKDGAAQALSAGLLAVGAFLLFQFHWRRTDRRAGPAFETGVVVGAPEPPPVPDPVDLEPGRPSRRREPLRARPRPPDDPRGPAPA
jgi:hypothetical protein